MYLTKLVNRTPEFLPHFCPLLGCVLEAGEEGDECASVVFARHGFLFTT
jgi:hypothetical protein